MPLTTHQALINAVEKLKQTKIPNPRLDAEILLSNVLKKSREYILTHPNYKLSQSTVARYALRVTRRIKGEPIAYITGHKEFYGLNFFVNKNVLVPRPETELMVDEIMKHITYNMKHITFIDIGTGSGCIIITLAKSFAKKELNSLSAKELSSFLAIDISLPALAIAHKNAKLHHVDKKIKILHGNLLEPIINKSKILNPAPISEARQGLKLVPHSDAVSKIIMTANLPYLTPAQIKNSPSIKCEPKLALSAGPDGLKYYRQLFKQIKSITNYELRITILIEISPNQIMKIKQLIKREFQHSKIQIKKDLQGLDRVVIINI